MSIDNIFQDELLPKGTSLAGYSYLIKKYSVFSYSRFPSCVSHSHVRDNTTVKGAFTVYDKRYCPREGDIYHLFFALKYENIDLLCLKRIMLKVSAAEVSAFVQDRPTGIYARKIWFFYEWLTQCKLDLPNCPRCQTKPILDSDKYFTSDGEYLSRYRLKNNLLGNRLFSPIIRKTPLLQQFIESGIKQKVTSEIGKVSNSLVARASSFLLLADSKASFAIEGERATVSRIERWGKAVLQAGKYPLSEDEITRLQSIIIKDNRFVQAGLRKEGVFLGERDMDQYPLPEFIGARHDDLKVLLQGLFEADQEMVTSSLDPVLHAVAIAFGFVYIHPLQDGSGRLHRYLLHHVLSERNFSPPAFVFPISSSMLKLIDKYRMVLRNHSAPMMDFIEWKATATMNVEVLNDTRDLYSYFDCTEACEFVYSCVKEAVEKDLPEELHYLKCHDIALAGIRNLLDLPDNVAKSLIIFIRQNSGTLPNKRRLKEFAVLSDEEVFEIETIITEAFKEGRD